MENGKRNKLVDTGTSPSSALNSGAKLPARKPRNPLSSQGSNKTARFKANNAQPAANPKNVASKGTTSGVSGLTAESAKANSAPMGSALGSTGSTHPAAPDFHAAASSVAAPPAAASNPPAPLASQRVGAPTVESAAAPDRDRNGASSPNTNNLQRPANPPAPHRNQPTSSANPRGRLNSFHLKILAIVAMTANHAAYIFYFQLPAEVLGVFFTVGGLTFPIMAFLLVEGYNHTSSFRKYATRLLVFALVSEVPFYLFLAQEFNVLFTLLLGLIALKLYDDWGPGSAKFWLAFAAIVFASDFCDWGIIGPIMILMMRAIPDRRKRVIFPILLVMAAIGMPNLMYAIAAASTIALPFALYAFVGSGLDIPMLLSYNGQRGRPMKWFFYAYYPAHILVLGLVKGLVFGDWTMAF